jgi:hypothetical protein
MNYPHTATLSRLTASGSTFVFTSNGGTQCFLQPIDGETAELFAVTFTKGSAAYLPLTADVKVKDQMTIDGIKYGVKGLLNRPYGTLAHKKAILEQL